MTTSSNKMLLVVMIGRILKWPQDLSPDVQTLKNPLPWRVGGDRECEGVPLPWVDHKGRYPGLVWLHHMSSLKEGIAPIKCSLSGLEDKLTAKWWEKEDTKLKSKYLGLEASKKIGTSVLYHKDLSGTNNLSELGRGSQSPGENVGLPIFYF